MTCPTASPQVEILDHSAFGDLADEWGALLQRSYDNRVFLTPTWYRTWWEHFGVSAPHILTLRSDESGLQAILPLHLEERDGQRVLTLIGDYNVADYMDALAEKEHAHRLLYLLWRRALTELSFDRIVLRHVPSTSPLLHALRSAAAELGWEAEVADDEVCPVALLCSSWDGYLQMLTKKQRHEIRRKLRRAQDGVAWEWRTVRSSEELSRDLPVYFRLHEASAREKARFMTPPMRAFFASLTAAFLEEGILRLSFFRREGVDVATTMSFVYRGRYLLYNSGYDPAAAANSPGIAAVALTMENAVHEHAVAFDFLSGDEPYKYQFGASNTYTCRAEAFQV